MAKIKDLSLIKSFQYRLLIYQSYNIMLSDEQFPSEFQDLFEDDNDELKNNFGDVAETSKSVEDFNSYLSSENFDNSSDLNHSMVNSLELERLIKSTDFQSFTQSIKFDETEERTEISFKSLNASTNKTKILPPPRAPIKKKKSFSCHDLQLKKNNYDHVESKVKKLIQNLAEDRRKTLLRHKSMPVCSNQTATIDDKSSDEELSSNDLKRELRIKSIKIYELEEKCEMKDEKIYQLELERSKMKMTYDKVRNEMQELKDVEMQYKQLKSLTSPNKLLRNAQIQTDDDSGFNENTASTTMSRTHNYSGYKIDDNRLTTQNPVIRQLAFENSNMNQSQFSDININNHSSDNLIPVPEALFPDDLDDTMRNSHTNDSSTDVETKKKKSKKPRLRNFLRQLSCIAKNKS